MEYKTKDCCEVEPYDLNGACVPMKKDGEGNLKKAEESIRERFSLGGEQYGR